MLRTYNAQNGDGVATPIPFGEIGVLRNSRRSKP